VTSTHFCDNPPVVCFGALSSGSGAPRAGGSALSSGSEAPRAGGSALSFDTGPEGPKLERQQANRNFKATNTRRNFLTGLSDTLSFGSGPEGPELEG